MEQDIVGIQRDGGLWVSETSERPHWVDEKPAAAFTKLVRFGNDHDWKAIARYDSSTLLLKNDGTLWQWGPARWTWHRSWPGLRAFEPRRLGTNSDWADFVRVDNELYLRKTDGSAWTLNFYFPTDEDEKMELSPANESAQDFAAVEGSTADIWLYGFRHRLKVGEDGTLHILAQSRWNQHTHSYNLARSDLRLGGETNWVAVAGSGWKMVTLKRDGSLWLWDFHPYPFRSEVYEQTLFRMQTVTPVRLGTHSDWIAISNLMDGVVALAADGSLWLWQPNPDTGRLLSASRKPTPLGNIFSQAGLSD